MKWPLVHFALLGFVLFVGARWLGPNHDSAAAAPAAPDLRIVVSRAQVAALVSQYEAISKIAATDEVRAELIARFAEEEMLFREAHRWRLTGDNQAIDLRLRQKMAFVSDVDLSNEEFARQAKALGMDSDDAVVRNMLAHNMRLLLSTKGEQEPTDEEVEAFFARERARFARPARLTGWHVFFSKDERRAQASAAARVSRAAIRTKGLRPEDAVELGDVSPSGPRFQGQLVRQLASRFGETFAKTAESLSEGQWSDPVETPFGVHLVLVEDRAESGVPPLAEVRRRVTAACKSSQREERLAAALEELRARYEVVVE